MSARTEQCVHCSELAAANPKLLQTTMHAGCDMAVRESHRVVTVHSFTHSLAHTTHTSNNRIKVERRHKLENYSFARSEPRWPTRSLSPYSPRSRYSRYSRYSLTPHPPLTHLLTHSLTHSWSRSRLTKTLTKNSHSLTLLTRRLTLTHTHSLTPHSLTRSLTHHSAPKTPRSDT